MSKKNSNAGTTYDYYGTIAGGVCIGPVDDLIGIILDGSEVWPNGKTWPDGGASFNVSSGDMYVFDAQTWVAQSNFTVPANPSNSDVTIPGNDAGHWLEYTFPRPGSFTPSGADFSDFTITNSSGTTYGTLRFYWGLDTQTVASVLNGNNDAGDVHPGYGGIAYVIPGPGTTPGGNKSGFLLGQEIQAAPNLEIIVRRAPLQSVVTGAPSTIVDGQCNLAAFLAELLTSENGIGLDASLLDATSFNAVATYLQMNELLYNASPLIDTADTLRTVIDQFSQMIDGFVRYNPATGLIELGVYQHGVTPTLNTNGPGVAPNGAITLTEDSLTERPQIKSTSWQGTYSRATVRYSDRQINFQQTSLHADDPRAWTVLKSVREISLDRPWITRAEQALLHGRETLRVVGHAQMTGTLSVRREIGRNIRAGDYVLLDVDIEPNVQTLYQFFRVTKRTIPMTGPIKLDVMADNTLAPIPANNVGAPAIGQSPAVPAVSYARIVEVPTVLSDEIAAVATLVQRPSNLVTGCTVNFDTNSGGTFPTLGQFNGFAARGTLNANVAATDSTITVNVDTTQPDADFFTQQFSSNEQADDSMLAFIVQYGTVAGDPGTSDGGQIAENASNMAIVEICSVSTTSLVSAGVYTLNVLRGRQDTSAQAFTSANSEVWLIPRSNLTYFTNANFSTLRANRAAGTSPAWGLFRFCPSTFTSSFPLSSAANWSFRFALNSITAPTLNLTAPASLAAITLSSPTYPYKIPVAGTWTDPNGALVEIIVELEISGNTRTIIDHSFAPVAAKKFSTTAQIDGPGTYTLLISARDASNFVTSTAIQITATGGAAACAAVDVFDQDGDQINPLGGLDPQFMAIGPLVLNCTTPGATIFFQYAGPVNNNGTFVVSTSTFTYVAGSVEPWNVPAIGNASITGALKVWATAPGYAAGTKVNYSILWEINFA